MILYCFMQRERKTIEDILGPYYKTINFDEFDIKDLEFQVYIITKNINLGNVEYKPDNQLIDLKNKLNLQNEFNECDIDHNTDYSMFNPK